MSFESDQRHGECTASDDEAWERLGDQIDRLLTVEIRPRSGSVPAGLVAPLYRICREHQGKALATAAARALLDSAVRRRVLVVTGAGIPPALPAGETDGPPGAIALARSMRLCLGSRPVLVTEAAHAPAVHECLRSAALEGIPVELFPPGGVPEQAARALLDRHDPGAVVFVERDGANAEGLYHGVRGNGRPPGAVARADLLALEAASRGILTIGIGDGGNEVGFGHVRDRVREIFPDHGSCDHGCPSGRITAIGTDVCVAAGVSNWGAYGIAAALSCAVGRLDAIPSPEHDTLLTAACLRGGAFDGATGRASLSVDGVCAEGGRAVLVLLREIARMYLHEQS